MGEYVVDFIVNVLVIAGSIFLFFLPFIAIFWYRNRRQIHEVKPHFNYFMERFFMSRESNWLVFSWALFEALLWFVIPEFLLILIIFMKVHKKFDLVKYDIAGTIIGAIVGFYAVFTNEQFLNVPYVYQSMIDQVHIWYQQYGVLGLAFQPFSGVPYKVFLHEVHNFQFFLPLFILIAIIARMIRYVVIYEATKALYPLLHKIVRKHYLVLFVFAILIFTGLLMRVTQLYK